MRMVIIGRQVGTSYYRKNKGEKREVKGGYLRWERGRETQLGLKEGVME